MARLKSLYAVLEAVDLEPTTVARKNLLKASETKQLKEVLKYAFDKSIEFDFPEGAPPYTPAQSQLPLDSAFYREIRLVKYLVKSFRFAGTDKEAARKKEKKFIELLECIDPKDAELMIAIKEKRLPFKNIDAKLAKSVFPDIF